MTESFTYDFNCCSIIDCEWCGFTSRMYDPVMSSFLSVDNYVQSPENSQNFNRYAYCLNNPLKYTDPSGESFIGAVLVIGAVIGTYAGGVIANGTYDMMAWDWNSSKTWGYMLGGALTGLASAGVGIAVAGTGITFCNTAAILSSSATNSLGQLLYSRGETDFVVSCGVASYNFSKGELGYLGKKGNSVLDNIGYGLGAFYNFTDAFRFFSWDILSAQEKYANLEQHTGHTDDDCISYIDGLPDDACAAYNPQDNDIMMSNPSFERGRGWAKSKYDHERSHLDRMDLQEYNEGNWDKNIDEFNSYLTEYNNAEKNGISIRDYHDNLRFLYKYGNAANQIVPNSVVIPKTSGYTFKMYLSWLRSFYCF